MKRGLTIFMTLFAFIHINAQDLTYPRWTFGVEWSGIATFYSGWHYNFFSPEGYRVNNSGKDFIFKSNAEAYLNAGIDLNSRWNIGIYAGLEGLSDIHKALPISIRGTYFWKEDPLSDRWFSFLDIGSGISIGNRIDEIMTAKIGGGYRLSLSPDTKLDILMSVRMTYTHPEIVYYGDVISQTKINRNDAFIGALSLGIAMTF